MDALNEAKKLPIAKLDHWAERFAVPRVNIVQTAAEGHFGLYFMFDGYVADLPNPNPGHPLKLRPYRGYLLADEATLVGILNGGEACYVQEAYEPSGGRVYVELATKGVQAALLNICMDNLFAAGDDVVAQASSCASTDPAVPCPWRPAPRQHAGEPIDHAKLATRQQLIDAFGRFTGMNASWFKRLKDMPQLQGARKVIGQGGRGRIVEPLFCPFEVMKWLTDPHRRNLGHRQPLSQNKGWELLERNFPRAYAHHSVADTR